MYPHLKSVHTKLTLVVVALLGFLATALLMRLNNAEDIVNEILGDGSVEPCETSLTQE